MTEWPFRAQGAQLVGAVTSLDFCSTHPHDFCASAGTRLHVFDGSSSAVKRQISRFKDKAYSACFRRDGRLLVAGGEDGIVQVFDSGSRALLRQLKGHKAPVHAARFAADQLHVLSGGDDGMVALWDVASGQQVSGMVGHTDYVRAAASSPTSQEVWATSGYDHVCKLWDVRQRRCLLTVNHSAPIESVAFFPTGSLLVTAGGTDLCIWHVLQGGQLLQRVTAHQKTVTSVVVAALVSSQPHILCAGLDGHVKVVDWDTFRPYTVHKYPVPVLALAASPAADMLTVGMADGALSIHQRKQGTAALEPSSSRLRWCPARLGGGRLHYSARIQVETTAQAGETVAYDQAQRRLPRHLALLFKFQYLGALEAALQTKRYEAVENILHALVEHGVLESSLIAAPQEMIAALLQQVRCMLSNPKYAESAIAVMHCLLTCRPGIASSGGGNGWLHQMQSMLAEELRTQEQLLGVLGVVHGLVHTM